MGTVTITEANPAVNSSGNSILAPEDGSLSDITGFVTQFRSQGQVFTDDGSQNLVKNVGERVQAWNSEEATSLVASQATAGLRPTFGINTLPTFPRSFVEFEASDLGLMTIPDDSQFNVGMGSFMAIFVLEFESLLFRQLASKGNLTDANNWHLFESSGQMQLGFGGLGDLYTISTAANPTGKALICGAGVDDTAGEVIYIVDSAIERISETISGTGSNSEPVAIGGDTSSNIYALDAKMTEFIFINRGTSSGFTNVELQAIIDELTDYYELA